MKVPNLVLSTIILFVSNLFVRVLGFLYKIFLSHNIGEAGLGIYHILFNYLMICLALTTTGIPTTLSYVISKNHALNNKDKAHTIFISTIYLTTFIAFILSLLISFNAKYISHILLNDSSLELLVIAISPSIIVITLSNTLRSYYYGIKNVIVPAIGQVFEQFSRILFVYFLISIVSNNHLNCYIALLGISFGELINIIFILCHLYKDSSFKNKLHVSFRDFFNSSHFILENSLPVTFNRVFGTLVHSLGSIIIPSRLVLSGMSYTDSLGIYGVISGMVIPLIYLPFTLGSALVISLIPSLSQEVALNNKKMLLLKIRFALFISFLVGSITSFVFYFFSNEICLGIFKNDLAGIYLKYMFLIPLFLTLNQTLNAILHTLNKEVVSSFITIGFLILQFILIFVLVPIPNLNIFAYIYSFTISSILTFLSQSFVLHKALK